MSVRFLLIGSLLVIGLAHVSCGKAKSFFGGDFSGGNEAYASETISQGDAKVALSPKTALPEDLASGALDNESYSFIDIAKGDYGLHGYEESILLRSQEELDKLISDARLAEGDLRGFQEGRDAVIGVIQSATSGGHRINLKTIEVYDDKLAITYEYVTPGSNCLTTTAMTTPYHLVLVKDLGQQYTSESMVLYEQRSTKLCKE